MTEAEDLRGTQMSSRGFEVQMLPPEVLLQVFEHAHDHLRRPLDYSTGRSSTATLLNIMLVCKTWRLLAEPLLYRKVKLDYHCSFRGHQSLCTNLKEYPHRSSFIENLELGHGDPDNTMRYDREIMDNLQGMTRLKRLSLQGDPFPIPTITSKIPAQISTMAIEYLELGPNWTEPILAQILDIGSVRTFHTLRNLDLHSECWSIAALRLPANLAHSSPLEKISFHDSCCPDIILELLKWPKALIELYIGKAKYCTLTSIQQALNLQSRSLVDVSLASYPYYARAAEILPDLAHFPALMGLELSWRNVFQTPPEEAARRLSCTKLRAFDIEMNNDVIMSANSAQKIDESHTEWLLAFVTHYRGICPTGSLAYMTILYDPSGDEDTDDEIEKPDDIWRLFPCLAAVRPKIKDMGIDLNVGF